MSRKTLILFVWLIIGAAACGQRGYFSNVPTTCSLGATIAATMITGPLNYLGVNPTITCNWPTPSSSLGTPSSSLGANPVRWPTATARADPLFGGLRPPRSSRYDNS